MQGRRIWTTRRALVAAGAALVAAIAVTTAAHADDVEEEADPAEVAVGERLFLETRFAQFFAAQSGGDANATLVAGDPSVDDTVTPEGVLPGPFAGTSMNCRACHLVDEQGEAQGGGVRTYGDFALHSPIPDRGDGHTVTLRNAPPLVNAALPRSKAKFFLHFDGEFASTADLVFGTLTGRNYGWLLSEQKQAIAHIAGIVRNDDGTGDLAQEFGGSYADVLSGKGAGVPEELRLGRPFRFDVEKASDKRIVKGVSKIIAAYVDQLAFARDEDDLYAGSPFDLFLARNGLPRAAAKKESGADYTRRLRAAVVGLTSPQFVTTDDGSYAYHDHPFQFGEAELRGLRIFLTRPEDVQAGATTGIGNCAACHVPPDFTDFGVHDTGAAQTEYDGIHGDGAFAALDIPDLKTRNRAPETFLPPDAKHPTAAGPFASRPDAEHPGRVDLGVWNVFLNRAHRKPQARLRKALLANTTGRVKPADLLDHAVGAFKTSTVRDLGQSGPYFHNAIATTLDEVLDFYRDASDLARAGSLRNGDPEIARVLIDASDAADVAAFLRSLDEDYD